MLYKDIRENIKTGDLLTWSEGSWRSWRDIKVNIIRLWTRSDHSHVGIAVVQNGRVFVLEAITSGVSMNLLSERIPFYWTPSKKKLSNKALEWGFSRIGDKYSTWQAILGGINLLRRGKDRKWQCVEYFMEVWEQDGIKFKDVRPTPAELVKYCTAKWGGMRLVAKE